MQPLPTPAAAEALIRRHVQPLPVESRPLAALAGAVLAQSVRAERDQPPFDRVTMDGIAIASEAWRAGQRRFRIAGTQAAGQRPLALPPETCLEVMTGAVLPPGSDCVIPVERLTVADGWAEVEPEFVAEPFGNVHTRGLDCREGDMLLARGTRLGPPELAVLASAGLPRADVRAEPRILIVATGDELVEPGAPIEDWQVRRSNSYALRGALKRGEVELHYQPKFSWSQNAVVGAEALMRWTHPELGAVSPQRFIPLAEETGLIAELGLWAIEQALQDVAKWSAQAGRPLTVAVNVSARQFELMRARGDSFAGQVRMLLERAAVDTGVLELEITESAIMSDLGYMLEELNRLRALGVQLAIDDFGTGYSSLAYLRALPVNTLKIDRSFVHDMAVNRDIQSMARIVVAMGKALNLEVVAEGVEKGEDADALRDLGCDLAQGWLYGRPVPANQLLAHATT